MEPGWVAPDACTLPSVEQPLRLAEFDDLFATSVVKTLKTGPTKLRLVLRGPPDLADQVRDLTDREAACCSFFQFFLSHALVSHPAGTLGGDASTQTLLHLDIEVPAARQDMLTSLATRASSLAGTGAADG